MKHISNVLEDQRVKSKHPVISELTAYDVGRWVEYHGHAGERESGRIKSWNSCFIFVVYKCNHEWSRFQSYTGVATLPRELIFIDNDL